MSAPRRMQKMKEGGSPSKIKGANSAPSSSGNGAKPIKNAVGMSCVGGSVTIKGTVS